MSEMIRTIQPQDSAKDQIEILTQELELSIHWQRPCVLMVTYDSEYVRAESVSMLEYFLMDHDQKITWIHASDPSVNSLRFWHQILQDATHTVFFLDGLRDPAYQPSFKNVLKGFDHLLAEKNTRLVFWLTRKLLN